MPLGQGTILTAAAGPAGGRSGLGKPDRPLSAQGASARHWDARATSDPGTTRSGQGPLCSLTPANTIRTAGSGTSHRMETWSQNRGRRLPGGRGPATKGRVGGYAI
eukprot:6041491-Alexandrium_andersonii.AAC.1